MGDLIGQIARLKTEEEYGDDGMSGDDAVETLSGLIRKARELEASGANPDLDRLAEDYGGEIVYHERRPVSGHFHKMEGALDFTREAILRGYRVGVARLPQGSDDPRPFVPLGAGAAPPDHQRVVKDPGMGPYLYVLTFKREFREHRRVYSTWPALAADRTALLAAGLDVDWELAVDHCTRPGA